MEPNNNYAEWRRCLIWVSSSDLEKELTNSDVRQLFKNSSAWMLRNIYDWDCEEKTNFWEIICDTAYEISQYPSKSRNQIRRSLRDCEISIMSNEDLVKRDGYNVYYSAYSRYHDITIGPVSRKEWEAATLEDNSGEYWGVIEKETGKLIAWAKNFIRGRESVNYAVLKAIPEYMNKHYPYFGLLFTMNQYYLREKKFKYVTDGFRSITEHSNIQPFLEKNFLFRKAYCKWKVYYRPWFGLAVKCLYPFRKYISIASVSNVLKQEEFQRKMDGNR